MSKPAKWVLILVGAVLATYVIVCILVSSGNPSVDEQQVHINADQAAAKLSTPVT